MKHKIFIDGKEIEVAYIELQQGELPKVFLKGTIHTTTISGTVKVDREFFKGVE